jgi:glycosyltransferase involved in cell wall biosynthesis
MKILYITNSRIPTLKAYGVNIIKTCEALAKMGANVTLIAGRLSGSKGAPDVFSYYKIQKIFDLHYVPAFDAVSRGWPIGFWINQLSFSFSVIFSKIVWANRKNAFLARDEISALLLSLFGFEVFYDMHGFPVRNLWLWRIIIRNISGVMVTNQWKKEQCLSVFNVPENRIVVATNGFDASLFDKDKDKKELRTELALPFNKTIVLYSGHLYDWKGANVLLEAARQFSKLDLILPNCIFVFVGGNESEVAEFQEKAEGLENILILGHKPHNDIPKYLQAADVLVLPNSLKSKNKRYVLFSKYDTSPIKLFEYMASGTPIVASNLPSIREILEDASALLVEPDNPKALAEGISILLNDKKLGVHLAERALAKSKEYTWDKRGERILGFIKKINHV